MKSESCLQLLGPNLTLFRTVSTLRSLVCILSDPLKNAFQLVYRCSFFFSHFLTFYSLRSFSFFFLTSGLKVCVFHDLPVSPWTANQGHLCTSVHGDWLFADWPWHRHWVIRSSCSLFFPVFHFYRKSCSEYP